jgi:hypothetical protein
MKNFDMLMTVKVSTTFTISFNNYSEIEIFLRYFIDN